MQNQFLPLQGIRVLERSNTLAIRLAGLLLADQGADVFALDHGRLADGEIDAYLNRGKKLLHPEVLASIQIPTSSFRTVRSLTIILTG